MVARGWWLVGFGVCLGASSLGGGCSRKLEPEGPALVRGGDAGVVPPSSDSGIAIADGGADAQLPSAGHGDAGPAVTPPGLGGPCDVTLMPTRFPPSPVGTLAAPGPYRPCDILGGQWFSQVIPSADGRRLAALGIGGQIQVLDARTLAPVDTFTRARGAYAALAISANGTRIAAGAELDGELDVWSVDDHALLLAADLGPVWPTFGGAVAISADGARAAASSGPDTVVADVATGAVRRYPEQRTCCTGALAFADGGRKLASARYGFWSAGTGDGNVALIDLDTGAETMLIQHNDIYGWDRLVVSADGTTILTSREHLQIWDAATGQQRLDFALPDGLWHFEPLGLGADGATFTVVVGYVGQMDKLWIERRRSSDGAVVDQRPFPPFEVVFGWSPADLVFGRAASGILTVVDLGSAAVLSRACSAPTVDVAAFSRDGSRLLDRSSGRQHVLDAASGRAISRAPIDGLSDVELLAMSPDGRLLAWETFPPGNQTATALQVELAGVDSGARATLRGTTPTYHFGGGLAYSADGSRLVALDTYNGIIDVFDVAGARLLAERQLPQPYEQLLGFTDDGEAVRFALNGDVETMAWLDGTVVSSWSYAGSAMVAASFDSRTVVVVKDGASPATTAYRDGVAIATMPGTGFNCVGGGPFVLMAPGGGTVGLGYGCSRDWTSRIVPGTILYETATGAPVQRIPNAYPVLSWDGNRFADGAVIWCR